MLLAIALALAGSPADFPAPQPGQILPMDGHRIQWLDGQNAEPLYAAFNVGPYQRMPIPEVSWSDARVPEDGLWVLPADGGAAVQVNVVGVGFSAPGECGGYAGIEVILDGPPAIAAVYGTPPASWHQPTVGPDMDVARRLDAYLQTNHSEHLPDRSRWVSFAASGDVARVRITDVLHVDSDPEAFGYPTLQADLQIDADGVHEIDRRTYSQYAPTQTLTGLRDVNGDGSLDVIETGCQTHIYSTASDWSVIEPQSVCCGC